MKMGPFPSALANTNDFLVTVELLTTPSDGVESYVDFFDAFRDRYRQRPGHARLIAVTSPQSPGGVPTLDPFVVWSRTAEARPESLDAIAHVTCKDLNRNGLESHLRNLRSVGVQSLLALTGDQPRDSRPIFELDALSLLQLIMDVNGRSIKNQKEDTLDDVLQFVAGVALNPYKYTLGSSWQQYSKLAKKISSGATYVITQLGFDTIKSAEVIRYLAAHELQVPTLCHVYFLTRQAAQKMHAGELAGCYVSDGMMAHVSRQWQGSRAKGQDKALHRMALQMATFREQGYRGAHLGGIGLTYDIVVEVMARSQEIWEAGTDSEEIRAECHFPPANATYFVGDDGEIVLPDDRPKPTARQSALEFVHNRVIDPRSTVGKGLTRLTSRGGIAEAALHGLEHAGKSILVQCRDCGDCRLPENFYALCHEAACAKGLVNLPCGDSDAITGHCGNNDDTMCAGDLVFNAAFAAGTLGELARNVQQTKIPELRGTSAVRNYLAGLDHRGRIAGKLRQRSPCDVVMVGESVHAHMPRVYWAMKQILDHPGSSSHGPQAYLAEVITTQVRNGADYIAVNVDAFPSDVRPLMMRYYVDVVNSLAEGVPVCIDSADSDTKRAGVTQYFRTTRNPDALPIVNSITMLDPKPVLALRDRYRFKVVAMLHEWVDEDGVSRAVETVDEQLTLAHGMFETLTAHGFRPDDIFFDTVVTPIAADVDCKRTYQTMQGLRAISTDETMRGVRTLIGLSNCSHMMPNRLAVNRAYLSVALDYGLTAAVLAPRPDFGVREPGSQIMKILRDLAENDGTDMMGSFEIFERIAEYTRKYGASRRKRATPDVSGEHGHE